MNERFDWLKNISRPSAATLDHPSLGVFTRHLDELAARIASEGDPATTNHYRRTWRTLAKELSRIARDLDRGRITGDDLAARFDRWRTHVSLVPATRTDEATDAGQEPHDLAPAQTLPHVVAVNRPGHEPIYLGYQHAYRAGLAAAKSAPAEVRDRTYSSHHADATPSQERGATAGRDEPPPAVTTAEPEQQRPQDTAADAGREVQRAEQVVSALRERQAVETVRIESAERDEALAQWHADDRAAEQRSHAARTSQATALDGAE